MKYPKIVWEGILGPMNGQVWSKDIMRKKKALSFNESQSKIVRNKNNDP